MLPGQKHLIWKHDKIDYRDYRSQEFVFTSQSEEKNGLFILAVYDKRWQIELSAALGLVQTAGVCIILTLGAYIFTKITNDLVIEPIENMVERVKKITNDPLSAIQEEEERILIEIMKHQDEEDFEFDEDENFYKKDEKNPMETEILEQTLYKIGTLMAIGYGEAGSQLIAANMA